MEFDRINELYRLRRLGLAAPWDDGQGIPPELLRAAVARGRQLHAEAVRAAFRGLGRGLGRGLIRLLRLLRRGLPRVPAGAHGPEAIDFDCAHGRPC